MNIINKEILIDGTKASLEYNKDVLGKGANDCKSLGFSGSVAKIVCGNETYVLYINGEEYYDKDIEDYVKDYYFEVNEEYLSDTLYERIETEKDLINTMITDKKWSYITKNNTCDTNISKVCPKGFVNGDCDEKSQENCEYSALRFAGLCYAECEDCGGEFFASAKDNAYVCDCSKISFKERHAKN